MITTKFILASNSPQRKKLLNILNIPFDVIPSKVEENFDPDLAPEILVCKLALKKAQLVSSLYPDFIVIGADTIVVLKNRILGKPSTLSEAREMLQILSGETHTVYTGVALVKQSDEVTYSFYEQTEVTFYPLSSDMIDYYVQTFSPLDKAGAYGIQDWSACFVESISGCYHNVVGFPLPKFVSVLRNPDIEILFGPYNWFGKVEDSS